MCVRGTAGTLLAGTLTACTATTITVHPALPGTWVEACGQRLAVEAGRTTLPAGLAGCLVRAARDDGGAVVRSGWRAPHERLVLPALGTLGTPGFSLARQQDAVVVVPYDWTPRDPTAPHPAWLHGVHVLAVDHLPTDAMDADTLHGLVLGAPGTSLSLTWCVPPKTHQLPMQALTGQVLSATFVRQRPLGSAPPPAAVLAAWAEGVDLPPDEVAEASDRWRVPVATTSPCGGSSAASARPWQP